MFSYSLLSDALCPEPDESPELLDSAGSIPEPPCGGFDASSFPPVVRKKSIRCEKRRKLGISPAIFRLFGLMMASFFFSQQLIWCNFVRKNTNIHELDNDRMMKK